MGNNVIFSYTLCLALLATTGDAFAQNANISWSTIGAGGGRVTAADFHIASAVGPPIVGSAFAVNTNVESGFLSSLLLRGLITSAPEQPPAEIPMEFRLLQNYPNPFNPSTTIRYQIPERSYVTLKVYDLLGREVASLVDEFQDAGSKAIQWNAAGVASGVYFYRLAAQDFVGIDKLLLLK